MYEAPEMVGDPMTMGIPDKDRSKIRKKKKKKKLKASEMLPDEAAIAAE